MKNRTFLPWTIAALLLAAFWVGAATGAAAGDNPNDIAQKAFQMRLAGQVDQAIETLETALLEHAQSGILHYELARAKLYLLDMEGMQKSAEAATLCEPDNPEYRYFAAMASGYSVIDAAHKQDKERMNAMGRRAFDELHAALAADPNHHQSRYRLVQLSMDLAPDIGLKVDDPEDDVCLLEEKDPVLGAKARACLVDDAKKRKLWAQILEDHPDDCRALFEAAEGLIEIGELEWAAECLDKSMAKDKKSCYGLLRLGMAYAQREDWDHALELTDRYLHTDPPVALRAYANFRKAMIHRRMGDQKTSHEYMDRARAIDPHVWQTYMPPPKDIFVSL